jgi:hypothetical protein
MAVPMRCARPSSAGTAETRLRCQPRPDAAAWPKQRSRRMNDWPEAMLLYVAVDDNRAALGPQLTPQNSPASSPRTSQH